VTPAQAAVVKAKARTALARTGGKPVRTAEHPVVAAMRRKPPKAPQGEHARTHPTPRPLSPAEKERLAEIRFYRRAGKKTVPFKRFDKYPGDRG
jgi:hypothetical protein